MNSHLDGSPSNQSSRAAYQAPQTLDEVVGGLQRYGEDAKLIAGGQSLLVLLRQGLLAPEVLISLKGVPELRVMSSAESMQIGAMVTQAELERSEPIREHYTALAEAASVVASVQVRNQGTLGGNLCHADSTADPPAALIALGATLEIAGPDGARRVPAEEFFRDFMEVDLREGEVLARIDLPLPLPASGSAYVKHRLRQVDTALVGAAAWVQLDSQDPQAGTRIKDARVGLSGAGNTPLRAVDAEQVLRGSAISDDLIARSAEAAAAGCDPLDDTEASSWYRREMVQIMVRRVLVFALERASSA